MPTPLADQSIILTTFQYTQNSQEMLNTCYHLFNFAGGTPDYHTTMDAWLTLNAGAGNWVDDVLAAMHSSVTLLAIYAQPVWPTRLTRIQRVINTPGSRAGTPLPQNCCAVIDKLSDSGARWGRGSWHQPGMISSDVTGGNLGAAIITLLDDIRPWLRTTQTLGGGEEFIPILWNSRNPGRKTPITMTRVQTESRVMRRRTVGVGA